MTHGEWKFRGDGGLELHAQSWLPGGPPRAVVAIVHGIGEHSGRYSSLVDYLVRSGLAVCGFDLRGHGKSPGARGHIDSWSEYLDDVGAFLRGCRSSYPDRALFLYGHSMGALIVADYAVVHGEGLHGLIVSGIPLQPTGVAKPHLIAVARMLSRFLPRVSISLGLAVNGISRDPATIEAYGRDPLVHPRVSMRWGTEILAAIKRVREHAKAIRMPILILHGGADPINSVSGSRELYDTVSSSDRSLRIYPESLHEPHNDLDRDVVSLELEQWILERSAAQ